MAARSPARVVLPGKSVPASRLVSHRAAGSRAVRVRPGREPGASYERSSPPFRAPAPDGLPDAGSGLGRLAQPGRRTPRNAPPSQQRQPGDLGHPAPAQAGIANSLVKSRALDGIIGAVAPRTHVSGGETRLHLPGISHRTATARLTVAAVARSTVAERVNEPSEPRRRARPCPMLNPVRGEVQHEAALYDIVKSE